MTISAMTDNDAANAGIGDSGNAAEAGMSLTGNLRQMIAVLERERQALATLDANELAEASQAKMALCDALAPLGPDALDPQTRDLARTAQQLNDVNRRVRNLLAANVSSRLEALGASQHTYLPVNTARA